MDKVRGYVRSIFMWIPGWSQTNKKKIEWIVFIEYQTNRSASLKKKAYTHYMDIHHIWNDVWTPQLIERLSLCIAVYAFQMHTHISHVDASHHWSIKLTRYWTLKQIMIMCCIAIQIRYVVLFWWFPPYVIRIDDKFTMEKMQLTFCVLDNNKKKLPKININKNRIRTK